MEELKGKTVFLGLGSNLGNREENLYFALSLIGEKAGRVLVHSSLYETEPWGFETENLFLNMVVKVQTTSDPLTLLEVLLGIEKTMGRIRSTVNYSSRIIDIDVLFYDDITLDLKNLKIPHPHLHERRFVLEPLSEIAPDFVHPVFKKSVSSLLALCNDICLVKRKQRD
jgi:2-amino-4-hydroxy-6-hydroxymethyldihydropteridine diphosphokinase